MKKIAIGVVVLLAIPIISSSQDFSVIATATYDPTDSTAAWYGTSGSRGLTAGSDLDGDGKQEIFAAHYGNGGGAVGFEMNAEGNLEIVWISDTSATTYSTGTRMVQTGDLDGDGYGEVILFRGRDSTDPNRGLYIYEWDGSDNGYDLAFHSTLYTLSGDTISQIKVEYFVVDDVDQDGTQELIFATNGPSMGSNRSEDFFSVISFSGDIGSGFESVSEEYWVSARDVDKDGVIENALGGGSAINVAISDVDGDGLKEVFCHAWNSFNNFFFEATGPNTYSLGDTTYVKATTSDHVGLMNAAVADLNGDGKDEVYLGNYYSGDVYMIYDTDGDATHLDSSEVVLLGTGGLSYGIFGAAAYDFTGDGTPEVYFGGSSSADDIIWWDGVSFGGALTDSIAGGFVSKMAIADIDGNGVSEIVTAHQGVPDSVEVIEGTDTTTIANPNNWIVRVSEYTGGIAVKHEYSIITPEDYKLMPAYPNPFNPSTTIEYHLPATNTITLTIYNSLGQEVKKLVNREVQKPGDYKVVWNGLDKFGHQVTSGIYIYKLQFGNFSKSRQMTLIK